MIYHHPSELDHTQSYVATIGTFDGVHLGHQRIMQTLQSSARKHRLTALIITFDNNPKAFVEVSLIPDVLSTEDKLQLLKQYGTVLTIPFDDTIRHMSQSEFIDYLGIDIKELIIGYDFRFGYKQSQQVADVVTTQVPPVYLGDKIISSTLLRNLLRDGDMETMKAALGRDHYYTGHVIHGLKRGKKLGFPTINMTIENNLYSLKRGVYITLTTIDGIDYQSVSNIGFNPTFIDKPFTLETHLLDFDQDIYGKQVKISFLHFLRDEMIFPHLQGLRDQIEQDITNTRKFFSIKEDNNG